MGLVINNNSRRWPNGIVAYEIDAGSFPEDYIIYGKEGVVDNQRYLRILKAIDYWNRNTTITLRPRRPEDEFFVVFTRITESGSPCSSGVGTAILGRSFIRCNMTTDSSVSTLIHEIGHTLGLQHEHQRPDRDDYVTIHERNIINDDNVLFNFKKLSRHGHNLMGADTVGPYDYDSIMHYNRKSASRNGRDTIVPIDDSQEIGQREELSCGDIWSVSYLYGKEASFIVAWRNFNEEENSYEILAAGFNAAGQRAFGDLVVNNTIGNQTKPEVAMSGRTFAVVWQDNAQEQNSFNIMAKLYKLNDGLILQEDFIVNSERRGNQINPQIAMSQDGLFVIVWEDDSEQAGNFNIMMKMFHENGRVLLQDTIVHDATPQSQRKPNVAMNADGLFVVAWQSIEEDGKPLKLSLFNQNGSRLRSSIFPSPGRILGKEPGLAIDSEGSYAICWEDANNGNIRCNIHEENVGTRIIAEVSETSRGTQRDPQIAFDSAGRLIITWTDDRDGNGYYEVKAAKFTKGGMPILRSFDNENREQDFTVNTLSARSQYFPEVACLGAEQYIIVWQDNSRSQNRDDIMMRAFHQRGSLDYFTQKRISRNPRHQQTHVTICSRAF